MPLPAIHYLRFSDAYIKIDYSQSDSDTIFTTTNCPGSHPDTFHISLTVDQVIRKVILPTDYSSEAAAPEDETVYHAPVTGYCLPYVSNHHVCPVKLERFMNATCIPPQIMSPVMAVFWSFAQEVVPVVTKDRSAMVRPFTMKIKLVEERYYHWVINQVPESSESMDVGTSEEYGFYKDCFEKVRFDQDVFEESCSICFEGYGIGMDLRRLPCSHVYHGDCIVKWLDTKPTCPLCRFQIIE